VSIPDTTPLKGKEECDDGNGLNDDACLTTCVLPVRGDGFVRKGFEECDDGNNDNTDGCLINCTLFDPCESFAIESVAPPSACQLALPGQLVLQGSGFLLAGNKPPAVRYAGLPVQADVDPAFREEAAFGTILRCQKMVMALPKPQAVGTWTIEVENLVGAGCKRTASFSVASPPVVSKVTPTPTCSGPATFEVKGAYFVENSKVSFGTLPATSVTYADQGTLQVSFSDLSPGVYGVKVSNGAGCEESLPAAVTVVKKPFSVDLLKGLGKGSWDLFVKDSFGCEVPLIEASWLRTSSASGWHASIRPSARRRRPRPSSC
jgi:cysteine-rich repeat protein